MQGNFAEVFRGLSMERSQLLTLVLEQIEEHLQQTQIGNDVSQPLPKISEDTPLYGKDGLVDSLGLVSIVLSVEQAINDELDSEIVIADDRAMSQKSSPFGTPGRLVDYTMLLINERK